jgi:hypothetical protein
VKPKEAILNKETSKEKGWYRKVSSFFSFSLLAFRFSAKNRKDQVENLKNTKGVEKERSGEEKPRCWKKTQAPAIDKAANP